MFSPLSKISVGPYSTTVTDYYVPPLIPVPVTPLLTTPYYALDVETGLNDSWYAQTQMVDEMLDNLYTKWLYGDICHILKYLKIVDGQVTYISNTDEYENNKICNDSDKDVEMKADFIEVNILGKSQMRKLLTRIINELGYKWYELPLKKNVVMDTVERYIKKHLKAGANITN